MNEKIRVDVALVQRGILSSREKAQALIMAGQVYRGEVKVEKPSEKVSEGETLIVRGSEDAYVSRGAHKLLKGIASFHVDPSGRAAMDVGASTGGFTDVLLRHGARRVFSIDVGYGQLDWKLRNDERVTVMERTNARYLKPSDFDEIPDLAVMDASFISITKILPALAAVMGEKGEIVTLIKPQFEAGRNNVGKKGVVREPEIHLEVLRSVLGFAREVLRWPADMVTYSPIRGPEGNIEFLAHLLPENRGMTPVSEETMKAVVEEAHLFFSEKGESEP